MNFGTLRPGSVKERIGDRRLKQVQRAANDVRLLSLGLVNPDGSAVTEIAASTGVGGRTTTITVNLLEDAASGDANVVVIAEGQDPTLKGLGSFTTERSMRDQNTMSAGAALFMLEAVRENLLTA